MAIIYHCTDVRSLEGILQDGLLTSKSIGVRKAVWGVSESKVWWAIKHVMDKRKIGVRRVVVLTLDVPRSWMRRHKRGMWYVSRDIPTSRIRKIVGFEQVARG